MKTLNGEMIIMSNIEPSGAGRSISDSITPQSLGLWT